VSIADYLGCKVKVVQYNKEEGLDSLSSLLFSYHIRNYNYNYNYNHTSSHKSLEVHHSDHFVKYPSHLSKGAGTFVVGIERGKAFYFDFQDNDKLNTAIIPTIKGANPISGRKTDTPILESYKNSCPVHGDKFEADRECTKCGYAWPHQNYVCHPGSMELVGFRSGDGKAHQFFLSEDENRDVASHLIGKENTDQSFHFSFFKTKDVRSEQHVPINLDWRATNSFGRTTSTYTLPCSAKEGGMVFGPNSFTDKISIADTSPSLLFTCSSDTHDADVGTDARSFSASISDVSVGAGKEVSQELGMDALGLEGWNDRCQAEIKIHFVYMDELQPYLDAGMRDIDPGRRGMLAGIPTD